MKHSILLLFCIVFVAPPAIAGPYSTAAGQPGSEAIAAGDVSIVGWATGFVDLSIGPVDITAPLGATASFGTAANTLGAADASTSDPAPILSLGDGGSITLTFADPIWNGPSYDFAVFENGFSDTFLELAFVEVSSDGTNFFGFQTASLTQTTTQVGGFGTLDPTDINNLAGKYRAGFGTPFDLDDLIGVTALLDINAISHIRITDVIGSINPTYATYDSLGNPINDPWQTNFASGGFDLDAVGAINVIPEPSTALLLLIGVLGTCCFRRKAR